MCDEKTTTNKQTILLPSCNNRNFVTCHPTNNNNRTTVHPRTHDLLNFPSTTISISIMTFPTSLRTHRSFGLGLRRNRPLHYSAGNVLFETETETVHTLNYPYNFDYDHVATMNRPNDTNDKTQLHNKKPPRAASTSALPSTKALSLSSSTASAPPSTCNADINNSKDTAGAKASSAGRDPCPPPLSLSESMSSMSTGITFTSSSDEMSATAELGLHEQHQQIFRSLSASSSSIMEEEEDENDFRVLKRANPVYDSDDDEDEDPDYYSYGVPSASKRARHVVNNEQRVTLLEDGSFSLAGLWRPSA
mmetsp:Transcript_22939/g.54433  ORF Transcript_22939/g.54433 Transcript_22939/m.54433 type:complete len:306 (+) Transcript_22939:1651-2568(+)